MILDDLGGRERVKRALEALTIVLANPQRRQSVEGWYLTQAAVSDSVIMAERPPKRTGRIMSWERDKYASLFTTVAQHEMGVTIYHDRRLNSVKIETGNMLIEKLAYWSITRHMPEVTIEVVQPPQPLPVDGYPAGVVYYDTSTLRWP